MLFKGTGTADAYTLTVTDKDGATIYTEEHPECHQGGVTTSPLISRTAVLPREAHRSGTYTLKVEKGEDKPVGTTRPSPWLKFPSNRIGWRQCS